MEIRRLPVADGVPRRRHRVRVDRCTPARSLLLAPRLPRDRGALPVAAGGAAARRAARARAAARRKGAAAAGPAAVVQGRSGRYVRLGGRREGVWGGLLRRLGADERDRRRLR
eukprot:3128031-Prymnesium_polylepis.1